MKIRVINYVPYQIKSKQKQLSAHYFSIFINILSLGINITRKKVGCINCSLPFFIIRLILNSK